MQRLTFILLLAISAIQCSTAVDKSTSTNNVPGQSIPNFGLTQHEQQQISSNHRELSSTSAYSTNNGVGYFFATLWYNIQMHVGPDCHRHGPGHGHCPCGPPHDPNKCHHSSSSSSGGSSGGGSSSSTSQTSSSSGGGSSSSSSSTSSSSSSNWDNDGYSSDGTTSYGSYNDDKWTDDGWNSNNLDNGGSAAGTTFIGTAKSIAPFLIGALAAGFIGAAFVVMRKKRQDEDAHPLEGSLKKRMKLFSGGVFRKKSMLDDDLEEGGGGAEQQQPSFVEISSVNEHSNQIGASTYESNAAYTAPNMSMQSNSSYVAPNMSMHSNNVYVAPQMSNVSEFHNEEDDDSEIDSEMGDF